uniref:Uncharacterized protein n=1 Tax=Triticum urartu TaxID=4572 RepID=A0A8R7K4K3_TRIUA
MCHTRIWSVALENSHAHASRGSRPCLRNAVTPLVRCPRLALSETSTARRTGGGSSFLCSRFCPCRRGSTRKSVSHDSRLSGRCAKRLSSTYSPILSSQYLASGGARLSFHQRCPPRRFFCQGWPSRTQRYTVLMYLQLLEKAASAWHISSAAVITITTTVTERSRSLTPIRRRR